jgi:tellurite methyltransferase
MESTIATSHGHGTPERFSAYYRAVEGRPPRETLLNALDRVDTETSPTHFAIDLGCGDGRDTVELLRRGWQVLGIDANEDAIARLRDRPDINRDLLQTQLIHFEELETLPAADLINASFSLQFCLPASFPTLWEMIVTSLRPGGCFCGQFMGDRDTWATDPGFNSHTRTAVEAYLQPFDVEYFEEEEHSGTTPLGEEKHWHLFQVVARKR